ncbi:hypothetical protein ACHHYP_12777 [Achlya hypogyna]|uniref:CCT domain-containing protein n=1 Tax=Achlya hypogyna TaxID=1202772 RepID=A0A1V9YGN2_ACHHY|nr:hypothetical protein ACHHYP_12777 [Achlya hypogyna]
MEEPFEFYELDYESMALLSSSSLGSDDDGDAWIPEVPRERRLSLEWFSPSELNSHDEVSGAFQSLSTPAALQPGAVTPKTTKGPKAPIAWLSPLQPSGPTAGKMIGAYTYEARQARLARFQEKRRTRVWQKRVKYDCRQALAGARPRVKGRFVKASALVELLSDDTFAPGLAPPRCS